MTRRTLKPPRRLDAYLALCGLCERHERSIWRHTPTGVELCHRCALALSYPTTDLERVI